MAGFGRGRNFSDRATRENLRRRRQVAGTVLAVGLFAGVLPGVLPGVLSAAASAATPAKSAAVVSGVASFTFPMNGQPAVDTTKAFTWTAAVGAQGYYLTVGTTLYSSDLVNSGVMAPGQLSRSVPALPAARKLFATLFTATNGAWRGSQSITFMAASRFATFTYPAPGQLQADTTRSFTWTTVAGAQGYFLTVGTAPFGSDLLNSGVMPAGESSRNIPTVLAGPTVYATLFTATNGAWTGQQSITFTAAAASIHGSVDTSFGTGGQVTVDPSQSTPASLGFIASTGQTLVGVVVGDGAGEVNSLIERLSSTGVIDTTFGNGGTIYLPTGVRIEQVLDAGGGKVLAVGVPGQGTGQAAGTVLVRLTVSGAPDISFGPGGIVTIPGLGIYLSRSAVVGPDGRIFVAAAMGAGPLTNELGIAAFTSTGAVDTTFGTAGVASTTLGGSVNGEVGLAMQPNGDLVIDGGVVTTGQPSKAVVARFLATGQPDAQFANGGVFAQVFGGTGDSLGRIAVAPSGDLVVAGVQFMPTDLAGLIAEITSAGSLKQTFGTGGIILENPTLNDDDIFQAVATGANNEVYGLLMQGTGPFNGSLRRYTSDGHPDSTFGSAGVVSLSSVVPMDMTLGYQGRPEVALEVVPTSASVVAERFLT